MKISLILVSIFLCSIRFSGALIDDVSEVNTIDGKPPTQKQINLFSFMASLWLDEVFNTTDSKFSSFGHLCGVCLLNINYGVTAATCLDKKILLEKYKMVVMKQHLRAGSANKDEYKQKRTIQDIIFHSDYVTNKTDNNIAVIKVSSPFQLGLNYRLILNNKIFLNPCYVAGWGETEENQKPNEGQPEFKILKVLPKSPEKDIIIVYPDETGGICKGDVGGPLVCGDKIVAIASEGYSCEPKSNNNKTALVDKYIFLHYHNDWLKEAMTKKILLD